MSYVIKNDGMIPFKGNTIAYQGKMFIVIHSTADLNATAGNIDQYFDGNWSKVYAFTNWAIDDKEAWQNGANGTISWGAGNINKYAWSQIEICEFTDDNRSKAAIANAVQLTRNLVAEAKAKGVTIQIVSHKEAQEMFGGSDHTDPIPYFNRFGYTMDWFRSQVAGGKVTTPTVSNTSPGAAGYKVEAWNKKQVVDVNGLNIRSSQSNAAVSIGTLNKGTTFNATRICRNGAGIKVGTTTYYTWFEVNGRGWVSGAYVTPVSGSTATTTASSNIDVDGFWGKATDSKILAVLGGTKAAESLQKFLVSKGYKIATDNIFGYNSIYALQRYFGFQPDGKFDKGKEGSKAVKELQRRLNAGKL